MDPSEIPTAQAASIDSTSSKPLNLDEHVRLLEAVVDNFPGGLLLFDKNLRLVFCNQRQRQLLEYPDSLFAGGPPTLEQIFWFNALRGEYGPGDPAEQVAYRMNLVQKREEHVFERTRPNGVMLEIRGTPLTDGGFVTTYLDVTEQRRGQQALAFLAHHDTVTELPNRAALVKTLSARINGLQPGEKGALFFLDLDGFKAVNDTHGHSVGDAVLRLVGNRLRRCTRETDFVCRFGGDEFVIIQADVAEQTDTEVVASRVRHAICQDFEVNGLRINIGVSVGIAIFPEHGLSIEDIVRNADLAMYRSKTMRKPFAFPEIEENLRRRRTEQAAELRMDAEGYMN